ncbi:hypothetical protein DFH29DRAFT_1008979 [Suillus ampliporus]|nr:hypothetical protein DFH29DRAFT_1008979 [Suillus ampliporus]
MLTSLARFTVALALASSVLGAAIPTATMTTAAFAELDSKGPGGALWKNKVHQNIYSSEAPAAIPTTEGAFAAVRRSGELWKGREHEEVDPVMGPSRRSELFMGINDAF